MRGIVLQEAEQRVAFFRQRSHRALFQRTERCEGERGDILGAVRTPDPGDKAIDEEGTRNATVPGAEDDAAMVVGQR